MADSIATSPASTAPVALIDRPIASPAPQDSRKRRRSSKQYSTISPESKISKPSALSPQFATKALTGAAGLADEQRIREEQARLEARHTSPNPVRKTLGDLLGSQSSGMSRPQDAPSEAATLSKSSADVAASKQAPTTGAPTLSQVESLMQTSPQSATSIGTMVNTPAGTITASGASVASPGQIEDIVGEDEDGSTKQDSRQLGDDAENLEPDEGRSNKAFTYPGPILNAPAHRTQSLPQSGYGRDTTRSPSTKRHKCPYCSTDFTRHHNLKSHLLTHSHEKPYSCDTCDARFRRLHDLKRHTKLHTGERPHVCPKCDRSFARGDALARHNKGQGGCAGRRSSMGSLGGDDKSEERMMRAGDGDSMPGIMYTGETSHEPEHMEEDSSSPGGQGLPSIRKHDASADEHHRKTSDHSALYQSRQPSTYPPVAARPPPGGLYPPPIASPRGGPPPPSAQSSLNQSSYPPPPGSGAPVPFTSSGPNIFAQGGMTESPKPLSPGGMTSHQLGHSESGIHRHRSPSLTQQFQQSHLRRLTAGQTTSPPIGLPPPHPSASHSHAPHLPSLPGLTPPEPRFTLHSQTPGHSQLHSNASNSIPAPLGPHSPSYPPGNMSSTNNSLSSHSTGPNTSFDRTHSAYGQPNDQLWAYVQALQTQVNRLQDEVTSLRSQLHGATQQSRPPA